jgi:hypothetical protein
METALVRQPPGSPAQPALRVAVGVAGGALMAGAALLQPFAASYLLSGHSGSPAAAAALSPLLAPNPAAATAPPAKLVASPPDG